MKKTIEQKLIDRYDGDLCAKLVHSDLTDRELAEISNGGAKAKKVKNFIEKNLVGVGLFVISVLYFIGMYAHP